MIQHIACEDKNLCLNIGASFKIEVLFTTTNGTGTGELDLQIETVDHIPVGMLTPLPFLF